MRFKNVPTFKEKKIYIFKKNILSHLFFLFTSSYFYSSTHIFFTSPCSNINIREQEDKIGYKKGKILEISLEQTKRTDRRDFISTNQPC